MQHTQTNGRDHAQTVVVDDPLSVIEQEARAAAIAFGVPVPDDLAKSIAHRVQHRLAGDRPYFASAAALKRAETSDWLVKNFRGNNYAELAKAVGLSERQVRRRLATRS